MYDISGWSLGRLWGATVDTGDVLVEALRAGPLRSDEAANVGYVAPRGDAPAAARRRRVRSRRSTPFSRTGFRYAGRPTAVRSCRPRPARRPWPLARKYDVAFDATKATGTGPLHRLRVAAAVTPGELFALREMNFDVVPGLDGDPQRGLRLVEGGRAVRLGRSEPRRPQHGRTRRPGRLPRGRDGLVGRGATGAALNAAAGLLAVEAGRGQRGRQRRGARGQFGTAE